MIEYKFNSESTIETRSDLFDALDSLRRSMKMNLFTLEEFLMDAKIGSIELDCEDISYCLFQAFDRYKAELQLVEFIISEYDRMIKAKEE